MAKSILTLIVAAVVVIAAGFYFGWFHFTSDRSAGNATYSVTVDQGKIKAAETQAKKDLQDAEHRVQNKVESATQR